MLGATFSLQTSTRSSQPSSCTHSSQLRQFYAHKHHGFTENSRKPSFLLTITHDSSRQWDIALLCVEDHVSTLPFPGGFYLFRPSQKPIALPSETSSQSTVSRGSQLSQLVRQRHAHLPSALSLPLFLSHHLDPSAMQFWTNDYFLHARTLRVPRSVCGRTPGLLNHPPAPTQSDSVSSTPTNPVVSEIEAIHLASILSRASYR
jgi:hypothetical protein